MRNFPCYLFFDIFASKTRMEIIKALWKEARSVQEICKETKLEQSNVSHQLKLMQRCHIVKVRREGKCRVYSLERSVRPVIRAAKRHLEKHCKRRCRDWRERNKKFIK
ncbi:MAG: winged helix-turn-helix transcriptional regulator [Candidatus Diapherotrites archaeon]|nr:winged helix-turn-helix transcriptional regulator [Candidatus Diapherotrites archaeon]